MKVSIVIPCYYSEATIAKVVRMTREEVQKGGFETEFILVNDGSKDGTFKQIQMLCQESDDVMGIDCAKNLGQHAAIMAGLQHTTGQLIMLMDDDMQSHPSQCMKLLNAISEDPDCDVVFAKWRVHREAWWRLAGSAFTTWTMQVMTKRPKDVFSSPFYVMRDYIRDEVVRYTGPYPYVQGIIFRSTSNLKNVEVEHFDREEGTSGYTLRTLIRLWASVLGFSMLPLRAASVTGGVLGVVGIVAAIAVIVRRLLNPAMQMGWPSLMAVLLICSGLVLLFMGIVGEYVGRLFITANKAPQYVVRRTVDGRRNKDADSQEDKQPLEFVAD